MMMRILLGVSLLFVLSQIGTCKSLDQKDDCYYPFQFPTVTLKGKEITCGPLSEDHPCTFYQKYICENMRIDRYSVLGTGEYPYQTDYVQFCKDALAQHVPPIENITSAGAYMWIDRPGDFLYITDWVDVETDNGYIKTLDCMAYPEPVGLNEKKSPENDDN